MNYFFYNEKVDDNGVRILKKRLDRLCLNRPNQEKRNSANFDSVKLDT